MSIRELLKTENPLVLPGAHDALSALLIKQAAFPAYFIGGYSLLGVRYGLPDIGLAGLGEMSAGIRDIVNACDLPVLVDADNGYGDEKTIAHSVRTYERMGVSALMIDDLVLPKRKTGKVLMPAEQMMKNLRAAVAARENPDTFFIGRTDALTELGMDEARRRAEQYLEAGADGIFIEGIRTVDELELAGRSFDVPQLANMMEGGNLPVLKPSELAQMGFQMSIYGISLLVRITRLMRESLADLKSERLEMVGSGVSLDEYNNIVGLPAWMKYEDS